jgi:hypothetical protein
VRASWAALIAAICVVAASCSSAPSTFALNGAHVDPFFWCPGGSSDTRYDLHATVEAHNPTNATVTVTLMTAQMRLTSVRGLWLEKVGDTYDAASVNFAPSAVPPRSDTELKVTITSACTSGKYDNGKTSSGDYQVTMQMTTSAGVFRITASNPHKIVGAA